MIINKAFRISVCVGERAHVQFGCICIIWSVTMDCNFGHTSLYFEKNREIIH